MEYRLTIDNYWQTVSDKKGMVYCITSKICPQIKKCEAEDILGVDGFNCIVPNSGAGIWKVCEARWVWYFLGTRIILKKERPFAVKEIDIKVI